MGLRERLLVCAGALIAFGASVRGPFHLDDYAILTDPYVTGPSGWWEIWRPLGTRPLTWLTFWANYQLGGPEPWHYHLVNLLLHLACVWVVWDALRDVVPRGAVAVAAAVFAFHPLQSEAVNYVFARATLLMALLLLLSLREWTRDRPWHACVWFGLALLAKEEAVIWPAALALNKWRGRTRPLAVMGVLALAAGLRVVLAGALTPGSGVGAQAGIAPLDYLAAQGDVVVRYFRLLLVPAGFTVEPRVAPGSGLWGLPLLAALLPFPGRRWLLAALLLLVPSSTVFPGSELSADRRMYLPALFAGLALGEALGGRRRWLVPVCAPWIALSVGRTTVWNSEHALWSEAVRRNPASARALLQLSRNTEPAAAMRLLDTARQHAPEEPDIAAEIGRRHLEAGRPDLALAAFGRALALAPANAEFRSNRGVALLMLGQAEAARADFEQALARDPCLFAARLNLLRMGRRTRGRDCRYPPDQRAALGD